MPNDRSGLADVASELISECATVIRRLLPGIRSGRGIGIKGTNSADVVTDLDRAVEARIAKVLGSLRPDDGLVGEEGTQRPGTSGIVWVCDPIDGSASMLHGAGRWAVSVAGTADGISLVGAVCDVEAGETFRATAGQGATMNGLPITVSGVQCLAESIIATDFGHDRALCRDQAAVMGAVASRSRAMRNVGSTALHICWVAAGRLDAAYQTTTRWWDVAASVLCLTEAGGVVSDLAGGPMRPESVVAATPGIHTELLAALHMPHVNCPAITDGGCGAP